MLKKKLFAFVTTCCLLAGMLPVNALAVQETESVIAESDSLLQTEETRMPAEDEPETEMTAETVTEPETESEEPVLIEAGENFNAYIKGYEDEYSLDFFVPLRGTLLMEAAVTTDDPGSVRYQWCEQDMTRIEGATGPAYRSPAITGKRAYICEVSDTHGNYAQLYFSIYVKTDLKAYIADGTGQTGRKDITVKPGQDLTLSVTATSLYPEKITYQWYYEDQKTFDRINCENGDKATYVLNSIDQSRIYYCEVSDGYGGKTSVGYDITVRSDLDAYVKGTKDREAKIGVKAHESVLLEVDVVGSALDGLTYLWYRDDGENRTQIDGAQDSSYEVKDVTKRCVYECHVFDRYGTGTRVDFTVYPDRSADAALLELGRDMTAVIPADSGEVYFRFVSPDSRDFTFQSFAETGDPKVYLYDEQLNQLAGADNNADGRNFALTYNLTVDEVYYFKVMGADTGKAVSFPVRLDLKSTPIKSGQSLTVPAGKDYMGPVYRFIPEEDGEYTLWSTSKNTSSAYWYYCYLYAADNIRSAVASSDTVSDGSNFKLKASLKKGVTYYYQVWAWKDGDLCSVPVKLTNNTLHAYVAGTKQTYTYLTVKPGSSVTMKVSVEAADTNGIKYQWVTYDIDTNQKKNISGATKASYTLKSANKTQDYGCVVTDKDGDRREVRFNLIIDNGLAAYVSGKDYNEETVYVSAGSKAALKVDVVANNKNGLTYQWENGNGDPISNATGASYTTGKINRNTSYSCTIIDRYGNYASVTFDIVVNNNLTAYVSGTKKDVVEIETAYGSTLDLKVDVSAKDKSGLSYVWQGSKWFYDASLDEWYSDPIQLSATGNTYQAKDIRKKCSYWCAVTDKYGNTRSVWFNITVDPGYHLYIAGTKKTEQKQMVSLGASFPMKVETDAADMTGLTYTWTKAYINEAGAWESFRADPAGNGKDSFTTEPIARNTRYICALKDKNGNSREVHFDFIVDDHFTMTSSGTKLERETVYCLPNGTITLAVDVSADDKDAIVYNWYRDEGERTYSLGLDNEQLPKTTLRNRKLNSTYYCEATNKYGTTKRVVFDLVISSAATVFSDVNDLSSYYYRPVQWAVNNSITNGYGGKNRFSPNATCTREQMVTFLWRMMGSPEPTSYKTFTDVKSSDWYYKPISWAAEKKITTGLNDGTGRFGVGQNCTREQCVTFLYRAAGSPKVTGSNSFKDMAKGAYYVDAVTWAVNKGITTGLNDGTGRFGVRQNCSRAMIVTFLYRYKNL